MKILIGTTNKGKVAEFSAMLPPSPKAIAGQAGGNIEWVGLADTLGINFPDIPEIAEDGATFAENASKKALGYAKATGLWTIADDSGLVVDALDGAPGVNSARFSGRKPKNQPRTEIDRANIDKLLNMMKSVPSDKRTARFVCSLCLAEPNGILLQTEGILEGTIAGATAGANGFGYDPIFLPAGQSKTAAQLRPEEKNAISHRGRAIAALKPKLAELLKTL
jgi:XTP/dITP diphosphohydrolase